ncbi:zinc finger BED domain-containing protein RICESLEEPER 2-like [Cicer arietinum]|uniref:Zinc finger BED domain-containing protein RICESLEEPER 2-like n=1 Tax=Cicer arietinum TaxID=3827 RepID=A0A1S3EBN5_CICAR|nr:zinc finger BED domain-containing protein RICESLEEPER 2-like [Cicer arietinum]
MAKCHYCGNLIKCKDGTSAMTMHLKRCKECPDNQERKRQKTSSSTKPTKEELGVASSPHSIFDQEPLFDIPSCSTLRHAIWSLYDVERERIKIFISKYCEMVCLTTDTWISIQILSYMSLTAHFIDKKWNLHKRILNFCQITSHTREFMVKEVETCLNAWELNRVFSITVDNASSNDVGIKFMKKWMNAKNCLILNGEYIHMWCCANILSLIVNESLKDEDISITRIWKAVKYVRLSPSRLARFKGSVEREKISYKGLICLDVETIWNSTYLMLIMAVKYNKTFNLLEISYAKDWDFANMVLPFLRIFYDATMHISGSSYVNSNIYMKEVFAIGRKNRLLSEHNDASIKSMGISMKSKYYKYWGNVDGINMLLLIAVVLDPICKFGYVNYFLNYFFEVDGEALKTKLSSSLKSIYREYEGSEEGSQSMGESQPEEDDNDVNASEYAFSIRGMVLDPYRNNLTPTIVEGLVCTQDWLKGSPFSNLFDEDLEELENL